jgi:hypothetical protein
MDFKFKKGTQVQIKFTDMFSAIFGDGGFGNASSAIGGKITDLREHNGAAQYKVSGFTGWWNEECLQEAKA